MPFELMKTAYTEPLALGDFIDAAPNIDENIERLQHLTDLILPMRIRCAATMSIDLCVDFRQRHRLCCILQNSRNNISPSATLEVSHIAFNILRHLNIENQRAAQRMQNCSSPFTEMGSSWILLPC